MRKAIAVVAAVLAAGALGCGGRRPNDAAPSASAGPSTTPSTPAYSPPTVIDYVPQPYNPPGYPVCGFYTSVLDSNGGRVMLLNLGVAVRPFSTVTGFDPRPTAIHYEYSEAVPGYQAGGGQATAEFTSSGEIANRNYITPPGTSVPYVIAMESVVVNNYINKKWLPADPGWNAWFGSVHPVTVTVGSHTLKLQVKPTKRSDIAITDNTCTVVP